MIKSILIFSALVFLVFFAGCSNDREKNLEVGEYILTRPHYYGDTVNYFEAWGGEHSRHPQLFAVRMYPGYKCIGQATVVSGMDDGGESKIKVTLVWNPNLPKTLE